MFILANCPETFLNTSLSLFEILVSFFKMAKTDVFWRECQQTKQPKEMTNSFNISLSYSVPVWKKLINVLVKVLYLVHFAKLTQVFSFTFALQNITGTLF